MTHAEMNELYELYALGVLEAELSEEIEKHLNEKCEYCIEHVRAAAELISALSAAAEPVVPPDRLRQRVLASVRPPKRPVRWMFAVAALSAACAVLLIFSIWSRSEKGNMRDQLSALTRERNELRSAVEMLSKPETRALQFGLAENLPHGRLLVNRSGALVFIGSRLPALATNRTFELWLIPKAKGAAPQPAGLFRSNASGDSVLISPAAVNTTDTAAVAVTVEPLKGSSAPTTKPFLVVPLGG
ncbi:MAG: anti-sigma factor [Bryobacteraceae bacterium]